MTRTKPRAPSVSSSGSTCCTVTSSGREPSSGVALEEAMAQLHLDPNTHVLNKFKLRCQAEGVPIGKTKKECKDNLNAGVLRLKPATPTLNKYKVRCQAQGVAVGKTKNECRANIKNRKVATAKGEDASETQQSHISEADVDAFFDERYGRDEENLARWQRLCRDLDQPAGDSINQCKKVIAVTWVDIFDYVEAMQADEEVERFETFHAFRKDAAKGRIYKKEKAKVNFFLKALLKRLF